MKKYLILALLALTTGKPEMSDFYIDKIIQLASRRTVPIRPGRSFERVRKHRSRHPNNRKKTI